LKDYNNQKYKLDENGWNIKLVLKIFRNKKNKIEKTKNTLTKMEETNK